MKPIALDRLLIDFAQDGIRQSVAMETQGDVDTDMGDIPWWREFTVMKRDVVGAIRASMQRTQ